MAIDYTKMDNKALEAMLEVATEENAAKIKEILSSRCEIPSKMSDDDLAKRVATLRINVGKRCKLVPFGTSDMICGTIKGVFANHTDQRVYYTIHDDDGLRHTTTADNPLLDISLEPPVIEPRVFSKAEWTADQAIKDNLHYVGMLVKWTDTRGEEHQGRVVSVIPDKRFKRAALRIKEYRKSLDSLKDKMVYSRKLVDSGLNTCIFSEDSSSTLTRDGYVAKLNLRGKRRRLAPAQKVELCRKEYDNALKMYNRAKDILEMRAKNLADAEKGLKKETLRQLKMEEEQI